MSYRYTPFPLHNEIRRLHKHIHCPCQGVLDSTIQSDIACQLPILAKCLWFFHDTPEPPPPLKCNTTEIF